MTIIDRLKIAFDKRGKTGLEAELKMYLAVNLVELPLILEPFDPSTYFVPKF